MALRAEHRRPRRRVTINYRLGALGWLAHPLLDGSTPNSSRNYGLMDQQFAMRWVEENIAAFGGDPHKATIAGESAGALDTCSHLASPTAARLFRGVIIESGCIIFQFPQPVLEAISGEPFLNALGCPALACLQAAPVSAVLAAGWSPAMHASAVAESTRGRRIVSSVSSVNSPNALSTSSASLEAAIGSLLTLPWRETDWNHLSRHGETPFGHVMWFSAHGSTSSERQ